MANAATKRLALIGGAVAVVGVGVYLMLSAFNDNLVFFYSPMQVAAKEAPQGRTFRMGGMVEEGSVKRLPDGVTVTFGITDTAAVIPTEYKGILPDLFKEGKGVVAQGKLDERGVFVASEVLAKHDENYMPPEAQEAVDKAHAAMKTFDEKGSTSFWRGGHRPRWAGRPAPLRRWRWRSGRPPPVPPTGSSPAGSPPPAADIPALLRPISSGWRSPPPPSAPAGPPQGPWPVRGWRRRSCRSRRIPHSRGRRQTFGGRISPRSRRAISFQPLRSVSW